MKQFLVVLVVVAVSVIVEGEGSSYCMTSTGYHQPSLYLRVCCVTSNLGQTVRMRDYNSSKVILCPSVRPRSCPPGKLSFIITQQHKIYKGYKFCAFHVFYLSTIFFHK